MSIALVTMNLLREHASNDSFVYGAWPQEAIDAASIDRVEDEELSVENGIPPLLIDAITSKRIVSVFDAVTRIEMKEKLERMVSASRSSFMRVAELAWRA